MGSTGLIGSQVLDLLIKDESIVSVRILVRRPVELEHLKLQVKVIDFADLEAFREGIRGSDAVFCAVGTTNNKVKGDKMAYRQVDYDIPVCAARCCAETGGKQFLLVSSVGADKHSRNFYLKLKGEVEEAVKSLDLPSISIFRPSMLLGKRNESRPMETVAQVISKPLSFLFPSKYKPIDAASVARAMVAEAKQCKPGARIYHYQEIMALAQPLQG